MSGFFSETEIPEEEVDAIILEAANRIKKYGMEMAAIMALESLKPLVYVGGELTRLTLAPFFPVLGSTVDMWGEKLIDVFEERDNIDKLIRLLEEMPDEEPEPDPEVIEDVEADEDDEQGAKKRKHGWWNWWPFD